MLDRLRKKGGRTLYSHLNPVKLKVIDVAFNDAGCRSFIDLGGIWGVDGGYARYAADIHDADAGAVVDDDFTDAYLEHSRRLPKLREVRGNFGQSGLIDTLGQFDVAFFFDVLLHQVDPDWDELLARYASHCRCVAIVQPQWNGRETVRLLDLGEEAYFASIPPMEREDGGVYDGLFDRLDEINPRRGRPWRDVHDVWQWGITDGDLVATMAELGYRVRCTDQTGPWQGLDRFHESVFLFDRSA